MICIPTDTRLSRAIERGNKEDYTQCNIEGNDAAVNDHEDCHDVHLSLEVIEDISGGSNLCHTRLVVEAAIDLSRHFHSFQ